MHQPADISGNAEAHEDRLSRMVIEWVRKCKNVGRHHGIGFDVPLTRWLTVTANFGMNYSAVGDVVVPGSTVDDVIMTAYNANFSITIR